MVGIDARTGRADSSLEITLWVRGDPWSITRRIGNHLAVFSVFKFTVGYSEQLWGYDQSGYGWGLLAPWASVRSAYQDTLVNWCVETWEIWVGTNRFPEGPRGLSGYLRCGSMSINDRWIQGGVQDVLYPNCLFCILVCLVGLLTAWHPQPFIVQMWKENTVCSLEQRLIPICEYQTQK